MFSNERDRRKEGSTQTGSRNNIQTLIVNNISISLLTSVLTGKRRSEYHQERDKGQAWHSARD